MLTTTTALYAGSVDDGYIASVHRMVTENRPVDPGSIQGSVTVYRLPIRLPAKSALTLPVV